MMPSTLLGTSWYPETFDGGVSGALTALLLGALLTAGTIRLDRYLDRALSQSADSENQFWSTLVRRGTLLRGSLWMGAIILILSLTASLSPPLAWLLLPAGALALAFAVSNMIRDALNGVWNAFNRRVRTGEFVAIGELEGVVHWVGLRTLRIKTLDGTLVDVPQHRLATTGIRQLKTESGGHPVTFDLPIPEALTLTDALEEARLAAALAPHAHMGAPPTVTVSPTNPSLLRIRGLAIGPFAAAKYRAEVCLSFHQSIEQLKNKAH